MADLSDMELVILGIIFKRGPCTSYLVSREFSLSPTTYYSGSAGAIYPATRRLLDQGYLKAMETAKGRRTVRTFTLSRKGRAALRKWLTSPLPESAVRITHDPIRVRSFFLKAVNHGERIAFAKEAEAKVKDQVHILEAEMERLKIEGDAFSLLAMKGMFHMLQARLNWLSDLRKGLAKMK